MKRLVLLFAALLVAGCGEKSSSEVSVRPLFDYWTKDDAVTITSCHQEAEEAIPFSDSTTRDQVLRIESAAPQHCLNRWSTPSLCTPQGATVQEAGCGARVEGCKVRCTPPVAKVQEARCGVRCAGNRGPGQDYSFCRSGESAGVVLAGPGGIGVSRILRQLRGLAPPPSPSPQTPRSRA